MSQDKWELNNLEDGTGEIVIWDYDAEGEIDGSTVIVPSIYLDDEGARKTAQLLVTAPKLLAALEALLGRIEVDADAKRWFVAEQRAASEAIAQAKGEQP